MIILHCEPSTSVELQIETPILISPSAGAAALLSDAPPSSELSTELSTVVLLAPALSAEVLPPLLPHPTSSEPAIIALSITLKNFFFIKYIPPER